VHDSSPGHQRAAADSESVPGSYPGRAVSNPGPASERQRDQQPCLRGLRLIGVFGGSFDPVHLGHLYAAATAQAVRGLERVVFVPAARAPHKPGLAHASPEHRMAMLELATRGHPEWIVDGLELGRSGASYTIDTLRQVRARWGLDLDARLFLILGSDNLRGFSQWKSIGELLELCEPLIVARESDLRAALDNLRGEWTPTLLSRLEQALVECAPLAVSSTDIRADLAAGRLPRESLPGAVAEYIAAHGIYGMRMKGAKEP